MQLVVFLSCLLVTSLAAPAPNSESDEVVAHANQALRWMEMYRLYQQQGVVGNPFLPAADAPANGAPGQPPDVPHPAPIAVEDASEEETEVGNPVLKAALNSDEVEEAKEVEAGAVEEAPVEPSADPAAAVEPAVVDVPIDASPVDAVAVDVPPVDLFSVDVAPEVAVNAVTPAAAGAAPPAVQVDPAAL